MSKNTVIALWVATVVLAIIAFIGGWVMGDVGIGFPAFLVRWIAPLVILIGFGSYRAKTKTKQP